MTCGQEQLRGPFSPEATAAETHGVRRTAVMVAHHLAGATRLMDHAPLIEEDRRIQVVYTVPPSSRLARGAHEFLSTTGALVMPWAQAAETPFDLAVAAGQGMLDRLRAPVMTVFHGAGPNYYVPREAGYGPPAPQAVNGLGLQGMTMHGRVIPAAIMLGHEDHRRVLAEECPAALPAAVVAGDLCFDRLLAGLPHRAAYRAALGVGPGQRLLMVSSHFGADSLLARHPDLLVRLAGGAAGAGVRVVVVLHPNTWVVHGRRQIRSWFSAGTRAGAVLLPPEEGWRAALVAADVLLADRSSIAVYGAALGRPVLLAPFAARNVLPGSAFARLASVAEPLAPGTPIPAQLDRAAARWSPDTTTRMRAALTSLPGGAADVLRRTMYRLLGLPEPPGVLPAAPPPMPVPIPVDVPIPTPGTTPVTGTAPVTGTTPMAGTIPIAGAAPIAGTAPAAGPVAVPGRRSVAPPAPDAGTGGHR
ncbi:hypothetical protein Sru01_07950 [Sphaerisporangium rufum]|uniref:CDP-Glycerol:Poly(Glycerophosphate) glycerophosphotransferase n=1 Tax=Sphaerisporangium rufum TaxID=1381558 RepID=A0A919QXT7_9ACTN|nr:hypothetical protein [Sphaerisporangium rufum]GII75813.1 hypothetical protein Sru01_07950 [Sphaerisporangium rufum]